MHARADGKPFGFMCWVNVQQELTTRLSYKNMELVLSADRHYLHVAPATQHSQICCAIYYILSFCFSALGHSGARTKVPYNGSYRTTQLLYRRVTTSQVLDHYSATAGRISSHHGEAHRLGAGCCQHSFARLCSRRAGPGPEV